MQTLTAALAEVWAALNVRNQTDCMGYIKHLLDKE